MEKQMETTIMENQMEKKIENEMETGIILGLYWDNGKANGNYYSILGLYWENGKENGNYYSILGCPQCLKRFSVGDHSKWRGDTESRFADSYF